MRPKTPSEIENLRKSGQILSAVLDYLKNTIRSGMTKVEVNDLAAKKIAELGGEPVLYGFQGFSGVICLSINDEVVHGPPSEQIFCKGDVIKLDLCVGYQGMITDAAITFVLEDGGSGQIRRLLKGTEAALYAGLNVVRAGVKVGAIGEAIEKVLIQHNLGIIEDLVGHGVGDEVHEPPEIPNYRIAGDGPVLKAGMTIAIEPMATLGDHRVYLDKDQWTYKTKDGSMAAQFEHTVLVTDTGCEILTG